MHYVITIHQCYRLTDIRHALSIIATCCANSSISVTLITDELLIYNYLSVGQEAHRYMNKYTYMYKFLDQP